MSPKIIQMGNTLTTLEKDALIALLIEFKEASAWSYEDMLGIDIDIVQDCIPIDEASQAEVKKNEARVDS